MLVRDGGGTFLMLASPGPSALVFPKPVPLRRAPPRSADAPTYPALPYGTVPLPLPRKNRRGGPRRRQPVNNFCREHQVTKPTLVPAWNGPGAGPSLIPLNVGYSKTVSPLLWALMKSQSIVTPSPGPSGTSTQPLSSTESSSSSQRLSG